MHRRSNLPLMTIALMLFAATTLNVKAGEVYERIVCPATLQNPRHDHQFIFPLKDERLLLVWSEYYANRPSRITRLEFSGPGGNPVIDSRRISGRISHDKGRTWSDKFVLQDSRYPTNVRGGSNLFRLSSGEILFFFSLMYSTKDHRIYMKRSSDECETWSEPVQISTRPGFHWINHDRILRLSTGRILLPTWWIPQRGEGGYIAFCYYSDDEGQTWTEAKGKVEIPEDKARGLAGAQEPSIVELNDGSLFMVLRTNLAKIYKCHSHDAGETWTKPTPTELDAPNSEHLVVRIPTTGDLLLVWNHTKPFISNSLPRTPLSSAISRDEGETWSNFRDIENHVGYDCAYPAVTFLDDEALITYYYGNRTDNHGWESVKLKIVPISWFYQGQ